MEKQYSVEFFMNFVENIQNLCHNFLEFNQNVEVSGYVCVDIDNMKKERYVLSEIVQMGGNSISESYCTKVFKTSPTGTVQRSGFRDITNARLPNVSPSAGEVDVPGHSYSLQRMRTGPPRKGEISHTLSLNRTASPRSQTKTAVGQNYGDYQSHSGISNSNNTFGNPTARGIQGHEPGSESQIRTKARSLTTKLCRTSTVPESSVLKRQHEHSPLSDSADDTDVIVVKQEPGDEEQEESGDQPPIKRRSETFRLPSSLTGVDQAFVPTPIINQPHPVPISSTTDAEDKSYLPSFSKDSRDSTYDDDTKTVLSEEEIKNLEEYEVELVHSDGEEEEESLDLTFQVPHTGGATQSSVPGAQDSGADRVVVQGRPGIYTPEEALALQLVELNPGSNVYISHVQMTIAERKVKVEVRYGQPFRNACPSARYLLGLFYTRQELANSSLSDTQYSKFRGLDQTVVDAITGFCVSRSECPKAEIRGVLTRSITSARCQLKQKMIASLKRDTSVQSAWTF
ncbi:uncharacterized protein [Haliotis asinina]|uniref:uncharacterized protein isoform X2 n=1 Tax=Haliotis asinina TaxID=109174 RepID=UPI003531E067